MLICFNFCIDHVYVRAISLMCVDFINFCVFLFIRRVTVFLIEVPLILAPICPFLLVYFLFAFGDTLFFFQNL